MGASGMLTVAEEILKDFTTKRGKQVVTHIYHQEINAETYAIAKADLILKGEGGEADNTVCGPERSMLSCDAFAGHESGVMLSNSTYGKSRKTDQDRTSGARISPIRRSPSTTMASRSPDLLSERGLEKGKGAG